MSERNKSARWTTAGDIAAAAEKLWSGGRLPSALISGEELFPYSIKLSGPKSSEMVENISEVRAWCAALDARSANERRRHYRLEYRSVRHSVLGKNSIPCRAVVETVEGAIDELQEFFARQTMPTTLEELGFTEGDIDTLVDIVIAAKGNPFGVFKPLTEKDMKAIYLSAF